MQLHGAQKHCSSNILEIFIQIIIIKMLVQFCVWINSYHFLQTLSYDCYSLFYCFSFSVIVVVKSCPTPSVYFVFIFLLSVSSHTLSLFCLVFLLLFQPVVALKLLCCWFTKTLEGLFSISSVFVTKPVCIYYLGRVSLWKWACDYLDWENIFWLGKVKNSS